MQHFCYGASQGQRASEVKGRGIFVKALLETLDLQHPHPECTDVDDKEGTLLLDFERAVRDVCAPTVTSIAAGLGRVQQPGIQMLSMGAAPRTLPAVRLASNGAARVRVIVHPEGASGQVVRLQMWSDSNIFNRRLPVPPDVKVTVPHASRLPSGLPVAIRCTLEAAGGWAQPAQQEFVVDEDRDVIFYLEAPAPPTAAVEVTIETTGRGGQVVSGMSSAAYERIEELITDAGPGIELERHETGPTLRSLFVSEPEMWDLAQDVASAINEHTGSEVGAVMHGLDAAEIASAVELPITAVAARRLGGLLEYQPVVEVGERRLSLHQLVDAPLVSVDPGPVTIRVTLPWGEWHKRIFVTQATPTRVILPEEVGVPPLRVRVLAADAWAQSSPPFSVITLGEPAVDGAIVDGIHGVLGQLKPTSPHLLEPSVGPALLPRWRAYAAVRGLGFPLNANGAVAIDLAAEPRAEPLSWTSEPNWDRLVSSGRLEDLSEEQASMLTYAKWESPLLGLAGAYACYAQRRDDLLPVVLGNLARLDDQIPDLPILEAALDRRNDVRRLETARRLEALQASASVPMFRWGVGIGVLAAEHYSLSDLKRTYGALETRLVNGSVWTLWRD